MVVPLSFLDISSMSFCFSVKSSLLSAESDSFTDAELSSFEKPLMIRVFGENRSERLAREASVESIAVASDLLSNYFIFFVKQNGVSMKIETP
jgi:hypothetical protein